MRVYGRFVSYTLIPIRFFPIEKTILLLSSQLHYPFLLCYIKGREDDNIDTIRKRFKVYMESSLPVIEYYNSKGKVRKVMILLLLPFWMAFLHFH